jgi:Acetyltransferase (GNAT) family
MLRKVTAGGREAVAIASALLQRARLIDEEAGLWEAADVQWWWRTPRRSDDVEQAFWLDADGPVATVLLTCFGEVWQCDPIVASAELVSRRLVQAELRRRLDELAAEKVVVPVDDSDEATAAVVTAAGLVPAERDRTGWMTIAERPPARPLPDGFAFVDRAGARGKPHPFQARNGERVEERLRQCSLYDPTLDLAVETPDGRVAAYSLYWFDPVTSVGLLEPMRVEEEFQRRGLALAMFAEGAGRLATLGARRIKVGFSTEPAAALYAKCGFHTTSTATWYGSG